MTRSLAPIRLLSLFGVAAAASACGEVTAPDRPDPRVCSLSWEVVYSPGQDFLSPYGIDDAIKVADDHVYVNVSGSRSLADDGLLSFPVGGGEVTKVRSGYTTPFWIEGDRVVYEELRTLYSQPIAGGEPEALFTVGDADEMNRIIYRGPWALDRDALYWVSDDYDQVKIWHHPRAGGEDRELATLSDFDPDVSGFSIDRLAVVGDELYAVVRDGVWILPKNGGPARKVEVDNTLNDFLGIAGDGTTLWRRRVTTGSAWRYEVVSLRAGDGQLTPVSFGGTAGFYPLEAWADGAGGWYVAAWEDATDGGPHLTISTVDTDGAVNRIACDPLVDSRIAHGAATADGVHLIVIYDNLWEIAAVSRTAQK
jgi:hypothetical protein